MSTTSDPNAHNDIASVGSDLQVVFNPAYSGYDGTRTFQIPAAVQNLSGVTWSTSDVSAVHIADDPVTGGIMITTKKAGTVKIIARAGQQSGSSTLNITQYQPQDCDAGDMRYNNMIGIDGSVMQAFIGGGLPDNVSCHSCHGVGAQFLSVQHTPEQTGGWSDDDLVNIITKGFKPAGSVLVTMIPAQLYQKFHQWSVTDQEKIGVVCYLRQITPTPQGMLDFGGFGRPGGTMMTPPAGTAGSQ